MFYNLNKINKYRKIIRFYKIYGFNRTYIKIVGRTRKNILPFRFPIIGLKKNKKNVAIIGCGQFAFANIAYFLRGEFGDIIYGVFDTNEEHANFFSAYYRSKVFDNAEALIKDDHVKYVYIASNHSTHTTYAIEAFKQNKVVYIEKPISVTLQQFENLMKYVINEKVFVGYNRPFSPAIQTVSQFLYGSLRQPLSLNCFIAGHKIPKDHWYRNFEEGTRICGNVGHWLDLSINLLNKIGLPAQLKVVICYSSETEKDDNLNITMTSDYEDIISIMLTSRSEPFEGINETINIQYGEMTAKIDDFRRLILWNGAHILRKKYFRKDVGHKNAILQPFNGKYQRNFNEIAISTRLMLEIMEAVRSNNNEFLFHVV